MNLQRYMKAYVPIVIGIVLFVLQQGGITKGMTVEQIVTLVVTAIGVYAVPNKA